MLGRAVFGSGLQLTTWELRIFKKKLRKLQLKRLGGLSCAEPRIRALETLGVRAANFTALHYVLGRSASGDRVSVSRVSLNPTCWPPNPTFLRSYIYIYILYIYIYIYIYIIYIYYIYIIYIYIYYIIYYILYYIILYIHIIYIYIILYYIYIIIYIYIYIYILYESQWGTRQKSKTFSATINPKP